MKSHLIAVTDDLFDVASRLKSVKETFAVYFNAISRRYEVHDLAQSGNTFAFSVPYDALDCRTVDKARYCLARNVEQIVKDVDENNAQMQKLAQKQCHEKAMAQLDDTLRKI